MGSTAAQGRASAIHLKLWGKADSRYADLGSSEPRAAWHPLAFHILDVAAVAERLLTEIHPRRLDAAAAILGGTRETSLPWLLVFVALHDLGKATPPFQTKAEGHTERLLSLGFDFPKSTEPHGTLSSTLARDALVDLGLDPSLAYLVARSVGAHHGDFAPLSHLLDVDGVRRHVGKAAAWAEARAELVRDLARILGVDRSSPPRMPSSPVDAHAFACDLAGLTTAADWVGSNADIFAYTSPTVSLDDYFTRARSLALRAVAELGFRRPPQGQGRDFVTLFGKSPWPLHNAMADALADLQPGSLVIVEAPMGEGKTEAALLAYESMASRGAQGLFFALPTQATANQILGRLEGFLTSAFSGPQGLHLVHGGSALSDDYAALKHRSFRARSIGGDEQRSIEGPVADSWFAKSKRALLAPSGVGTVDQALLGVLRSRHHFLRLHGLANKVFIVDEVHAYDIYTSSILARLCEWLRALGATVLLLSATLASAQRDRLIRSFGGTPPEKLASYPRLTVVAPIESGEPCRAVARSFVARKPSFEVALEWKDGDAATREVCELVRREGNVAWIVNTVARAQELFLDMQTSLGQQQDIEVHLLHARLPFADRLARERQLAGLFGPPGPKVRRPKACLLIGTQVLEQSLDFDFDLIVTELAPVDLVLQRAGRLHRHERPHRPPSLERRRLWIERPTNAAGDAGPSFGPAKFVYGEAILLASWAILRDRTTISLPDDIGHLVERVYQESGDLGLSERESVRLAELRREEAEAAEGNAYKADTRLLPSPAADDPFSDFSCHFDEEDPAIHEELRAVTRLGEPSVNVVCVVPTNEADEVSLANNPSVRFRPDATELPLPIAISLARSSLRLSQRRLVSALLPHHPRAFRRSGHLRQHRLLRLDRDARAVVGGLPVMLHPALGLVTGTLVERASSPTSPQGVDHA